MKKLALVLLLSLGRLAQAQTTGDCETLAQQAKGSWRKLIVTDHASSAADAARERPFLEAVQQMLQPHDPGHLTMVPTFSMSPARAGQPVNAYSYTLMALPFICTNNKVEVYTYTSTALHVNFNFFNETALYDTSTDIQLSGYFDLRHGLPVEIRPGIWQFPDDREPLATGWVGTSRLWLISFDGKLPWSYVTRREFLVKRKRNLQSILAGEDGRLKEQLEKWEMEKKREEQEYQQKPDQLKKFLDNTYLPAIAREQENYRRSVADLNKAIARVEEQLTQPGLEKNAIVIKNQQSLYDYDFTDKAEPFAEVLTKPNPPYFDKKLARSVPQFISIEIIYYQDDPNFAAFAQSMTALINLDYLKSFIGKTAPGAAAVKPASTPQQTAVPAKAVAEPAAAGTVKTVSKAALPSGLLWAPAGTVATLTLGGGNEVTVSLPKTPGKLYGQSGFSFPKPVKDQTAYALAISNMPGNMRGVVYSGKGTAPAGLNQLRAGMDYTYELVSRSSNDKTTSGFYECGDYTIGGYQESEGRYVAFVSLTAGLEGSSGKYRQLFWRDRNTGITKLVSVSPAGEQGNGDCYAPSLSADGQSLVFESNASNLVAGDNNNAKDIFIWNAGTNSIQVVSKAIGGGFADAESFDASLSGNGQYVVFSSSAGNLSKVPKGQSISNVFVRDLAKEETEMVSVDPVLKTGGNAGKGSISFDGSRISFSSASPNLVKDDNNGLWDIFLWQRGMPELRRVSKTHDGKERNQGQESASRFVGSALSGNGRYLAYSTTASNVVANDSNNFQDVFVVDLETGKVITVSQTDDGQAANNDSPIEQAEKVAISHDGTWIAFPTKSTNLGAPAGNIILHNLVTGKKQVVSSVQGSYVGKPAISYSGSYVLFAKSAPLDNRFSSSGIFAHFTGNGPCRADKQ